MAELLEWPSAVDFWSVVQRAADALGQGRLVAFPTETVYGIAAYVFAPEAVERLVHVKGRPEEKPLTLALVHGAQATDWVPQLSRIGRRLARRCWPGPLTLVCGDGVREGLMTRLPEPVQRRLCPAGMLGLRVPDHDAIRHVMQLLGGPLVLTSANRSGGTAAVDAGHVLEAVGEGVDLVIDGGPSRYGRASTVVEVNGSTWRVLREGVLSREELERQSAYEIVFVCTGNTCRSPLAEALCKKRLAERLGCAPADLPRHGFAVQSAGLAAMIGDRAAPEAIDVGHDLGVDLTSHVSQPLTAELVARADLLVVMTQAHLAGVLMRYPGSETPIRLLCGDGNDVPDPIGCDEGVYRECAQQISASLERLLIDFDSGLI
ncbi:MAG TPA: L-threonylcarbamoyladenylate synthase [Gemmataceae bacterium]|nr:L-threonylcarbamoyladenylate synthase [Gemmataceae bacterium]